MKNILKTTIALLLVSSSFVSCELDEWNPSTVDIETAYKY